MIPESCPQFEPRAFTIAVRDLEAAGLLRDNQVVDPPRKASQSPDYLAIQKTRWLRDFCVTQ